MGKKRYIQVGRKRIKVASSITERELLMWIIRYLKPKQKRTKRKQGNASPFDQTGVANYDAAKSMLFATATHDKLARQSEQLQRLEQKVEAHALPGNMMSIDQVQFLAGEADKHVRKRLKDKNDEIKQQELQVALLKDEDAQIRKAVVAGEAKLNRAKAKTGQLEVLLHDMNGIDEEIQKTKHKIDKLAAAAVQKEISKYTVPQLIAISDMDNTQYKNLHYTKAILLEELEENGKIDRDAMAKEYIAKYLAKEEKELEELLQHRDIVKADRQKVMDGEGAAGKTRAFCGGISDAQINVAMSKYPEYLGTVAADEIHTLLSRAGKSAHFPKRVCWIVNTDPRGKPGVHWCAMFIDVRPEGSHSAEFYDPLAKPIPDEWLAQLKLFIRQMHGMDSYLKFRQNMITDQSDTSSNCGPFCIHFLQQRLKGETFGKASGWDAAGERNIEAWKMLPHQQTWISGQSGEGLRDIYSAVRKGAARVVERIKQTIGIAQNGVSRASPAVRGWLSKYGDLEIDSITIAKKPVYSMIEKIGNWFSSGRLKENMDKMGYDRLMHLYMIIRLKGGPTIKLEKNHVVEIKSSADMGKAQLSGGRGGTVSGRLAAAEKKHGAALWQYDSKSQNCQYFVTWFLGNASAEMKAFVMQDAAKTLENMGLIEKAARVVTDIAAVADVALNGAGIKTLPGII